MPCDAQTLVNLATTNKAASLPRRGVAECIAYQSSQHSGGAPFSPSDIAGLSLWLDANVGVTQVAGDVHQWADQSGNGLNFSQTGVISDPQFQAAGLNGKPTLAFTNAGLKAASGPKLPLTIFAVLKSTNPLTDPQSVIACDPILSAFLVAVSNSQALDYYDGAGETVTTSPTYTNGVPFLAEVINDGVATPAFWTNGAPQGLSQTSSGGSGLDDGPMLVGYGDLADSLYPLLGSISEVIVYNSALSPSNRVKVEAYLNTKWALGF